MESFNYDSAKKYATTLIKEKFIYWLEPDDVVNDAFIQLSESGKQYSWDLCREVIKNIIFNEKHNNIDAIYRTKDATRQEIDNKQCLMCKEVKSKHEFYILTHKSGTQQFSSYCKICCNIRRKNEIKTPERLASRRATEKKSNKKYWDKIKNKPSIKMAKNKYIKGYYQKNRERSIQQSQQYKKEHPEETKAYRKEYRLKNNEKLRAYAKQYRLKNKLKNEEQ